jgi:hypothetical protein
MKKFNLIFISFLILSCSGKKETGVVVKFPEVSSAMQITSNDKEHLFASYYGINSFDKSERYVTVLETDLRYKLPDENEPATLGLVDLETKEFIPLTKTRAWNFQQGCMAHWIGDKEIIYNDFRDGKFISVVMDVNSKKELRTYQYPVSAVSFDGKEALSINFARLRLTRPDYGYGGEGQDSRKDIPFPTDDGLFLINLETGVSKLLVSYDQVKSMVPPLEEGKIEWFNHTLFSRKGSKSFGFPDRWIKKKE